MYNAIKIFFVVVCSLLLGGACVPDRDKLELGASITYRFGDNKSKSSIRNTPFTRPQFKPKYTDEQIINYRKRLKQKELKENQE